VGLHIVQELLDQGARVRVPIHQRPLAVKDDRIEVFPSDLTKQEDCLAVMQGVDCVFHAAGFVGGAGVGVDEAFANIGMNLVLAVQVIRAAWTAGVDRFLLFSSSAVYPAIDFPLKEEQAWAGSVHPSYFGYGWMRRYLEKLGEFVALKSKIKVALVRPTAIYGRWDNFDAQTSHVIPALIRKAVQKQNPFEVWGSGQEVRDFLHVSDLARGSLLALEKHAVCDPINIGYGKGYAIKDVVGMILKSADYREARVVFDESKPSTIPFRMVDISKAKLVLGFQPRVSLEEGLNDTVRWFKQNHSS